MIPPIEKMDNTLGTLKACVHLSLGSNAIDKIAGLAGLENLRVLALSRNAVKVGARGDPKCLRIPCAGPVGSPSVTLAAAEAG